MNRLIECGDHKYAPWCLVCIHILNGMTQECVRVPTTEDGQQDDWLCPDCFQRGPDGLGFDDVHCVCIHCARKLVECMRQM